MKIEEREPDQPDFVGACFEILHALAHPRCRNEIVRSDYDQPSTSCFANVLSERIVLRAERLMEYRGNQFARRTRQDEQISDDSFKKPRKKKS